MDSSIDHDDEDEGESEEEELVPPPSSWFENCTTSTSKMAPATEYSSEPEFDSTNDNLTTPEPPQNEVANGEERVAGIMIPLDPSHYAPPQAVGNTHPSPSWKEISSQVLPAAARELLSSSLRRIYYTARLSYARGRWHRKYSDIGNNSGGFIASPDLELPRYLSDLPSFSNLPWVDRQLVREWRTYLPDTPEGGDLIEKDDFDFDRARSLVPNPLPRPPWQKTDVCHQCHKPFGPTRLRHHCRMCGFSFCQPHSASSHQLPHLGYEQDVPERVCDVCKRILQDQNLAERIAWRLARCRDYSEDNLTPYFETGLDSAGAAAKRVAKAAIAMAKSIPLGAQATVAVETVDVLRKYGLQGIYGIMVRQEFLAAADMLRRALGINKTSWPLSVHELSAAIFYALAQHRAMRGLNPEREEIIHSLRISPASERKKGAMATWTDPSGVDTRPGNIRTTVPSMIDNYELAALSFHNNPVIDQTDTYDPDAVNLHHMAEAFDAPMHDPRERERFDCFREKSSFEPVCDFVPDAVMNSLVFYAPIALNFVYATKEVDMQLLAAQQGWRLLYAYLDQKSETDKLTDRPASALFLHEELKIACLAIRGTATINDVVTDIRQTPVPFPETELQQSADKEGDWTNVFEGKGLALCGMAAAASNLFREHIDSLSYFVKQGYKIRVTGHSLGGGVAALIGVLVLRHFERYFDIGKNLESGMALEDSDILRVYSYGTPSCLDAKLAASVNSFVTTVLLHDDVFPRLTPTSCRGLLKHLLHIRETWVKTHMEDDLRAVGARARTVWAPRIRHSFAIPTSSKSIKMYCKKQIKKGKKKLLSVKDKLVGDQIEEIDSRTEHPSSQAGDGSLFAEDESFTSDPNQWGERFFVPGAAGSIAKSLDTPSSGDGPGHADEQGVDQEPPPQLLLEFLGGVDTRAEGVVIDGDEFFDTEDNLVESDDEASKASSDIFCDPGCGRDEEPIGVSGSWSFDAHGGNEDEKKVSSPAVSSDDDCDAGRMGVVVEEVPLPRMFVPGKVIHIYSHRGVYKAAYVPRTFRELRRISLAGNMLSNHLTKSYYEALLEVQTARVAPERPPRWTAFDEDDTCCCCASKFTWASTSDSEAQEARDKHNCRSCGGLVCNPCASNRVPIPSIGITVPVRVCDRCYHDMGGHSVASSSMTSSFLAVSDDDHASRETSPARTPTSSTPDQGVKIEDRPERKREKRSLIVDDLASRIRSSALTTCS